MKKKNYTEMFKSAKKLSEDEQIQITCALKHILTKRQVCEAVINKALYCPFSKPKL